MKKGISVFTGMDYSLEENLEYIKTASQLGFTEVFTSLHIPEADYEKALNEFKEMSSLCKSLNMTLIVDISPRAFKYLNIRQDDLKAIKDLGVDVLRIDFGYSVKEIADFTNNKEGLMIEVNASTITPEILESLSKEKADFSNLQGCHNYYPRLNTGISVESLIAKNKMLKEKGIKISGFIPSQKKRRGPIYEGLPTLEIHRFISPEASAKHLFLLGCDTIIFGDAIASNEEMKSVGDIEKDVIELRVIPFTNDELEKKIIFDGVHENRTDGAEDVIRSTTSRENIKGVIPCSNTVERKKGSITIDNIGYKRYSGELQICRKKLPADFRVNVVGEVVQEELMLIDYIKDGSKFKFKNIL
ncbi:DUF871 domain-containing protein [Clostridium polynesiense]|uniref:DUF871 domain-containing protein n=1 Tax=Clostridium polynesiense TaxID=1325933 RepID=UPI000590B608|nr:MupG family TIM beta-alpha barrel fold protein [Clostridium polynesiense]